MNIRGQTRERKWSVDWIWDEKVGLQAARVSGAKERMARIAVGRR